MKSDQLNRREFLASSGVWAAGAALVVSGRVEAGRKQKIKLSAPRAAKKGWRLACGLYTFRDRSFYEALDAIAALGIRDVEPCFFLSLSKEHPDLKTSESLSASQRSELKSRLADRGMRMVNYYADLGSDTGNFRKVFDFAKEMGARTLVAEPPAEVFDAIEPLCEEYKISLAVHNHPESPDSKYWRPENVLKVCQGRSKRIGACPDTGHWVRSGLDPVQCLKKLKGRVITVHLKDAAESGKRDARDVPLGTGKADYTGVLQELDTQGFRGVMTIEYEHLSAELAEDVAKCVKFVEDFAASLKS